MKNRIKKYCIFAASLPKMTLRSFVGMAIFIAIHTAEAANYRLSNFNGCCSLKTAIVFGEMKGDSLIYFNNLNILFMPKTTNLSDVNNTITRRHEEILSNEFFRLIQNSKNVHLHFTFNIKGDVAVGNGIVGNKTGGSINDTEIIKSLLPKETKINENELIINKIIKEIEL